MSRTCAPLSQCTDLPKHGPDLHSPKWRLNLHQATPRLPQEPMPHWFAQHSYGSRLCSKHPPAVGYTILSRPPFISDSSTSCAKMSEAFSARGTFFTSMPYVWIGSRPHQGSCSDPPQKFSNGVFHTYSSKYTLQYAFQPNLFLANLPWSCSIGNWSPPLR